jgi:type II secretory pathway pseudopilin PulG
MKNLRNRNSLLALIVSASAALSFPAFAQSAGQDATTDAGAAAAQAQAQSNGGGQTWASVDTDGNGSISRSEAQVNPGLAQVFDQADADSDGQLTPDEYKAFVEKQASGT